MTKDKAIHSFMSQYGIPAYPSNNVPDDVVFPWLTYTMGSNGFGGKYAATVHLYYHTESEAAPNAKAEQICASLRHGGRSVAYDGGMLWMRLGSPEWFSQPDQGDRTIKHRIINIDIEFLGE